MNLFKNGKKTLVTSFLFAALALSATNVAQATDQQALEKLNNIKLSFSLLGYSCRNSVSGGYQRQGETSNIYITLYKGVRYKLVAAGNVHVKDIDITLHDENHNVIAKDYDNDSMPIVNVTPRWSGRFHAKLKTYRGKGYSYLMVCYQK